MTEQIEKTVFVPKGPVGPKLSPRERAAKLPNNAKLAIAAYCYHDCFGEEERNSHAIKNNIKNCENTGCQLWPFRGWQDITGGLCREKDRTGTE